MVAIYCCGSPDSLAKREGKWNMIQAHHVDSEFSYLDCLKREATHRVRIFENVAWTTILITDLSTRYVCPSVTNSLEDLINAFLADHREIREARMVVIEHYDDRPFGGPGSRRGLGDVAEPESFDLVSFSKRADGSLYDPQWKRIAKQEAERWTGVKLP